MQYQKGLTMSDTPQIWVFAYDIVSNRNRLKAADILEARAVRVQLSVFEARLTKAQAKCLFDDVARCLEKGDKLRAYPLPVAAAKDVMSYGGPPIPEPQEFWLL